VVLLSAARGENQGQQKEWRWHYNSAIKSVAAGAGAVGVRAGHGYAL